MFKVDKQLNYGREILTNLASNCKYNAVLDLGAGQGVDLNIFKSFNKSCETYAVEAWESNIKILEDNGHIVVGTDIEKEKLPFENDSMDIIIMNQILEHTKDIFWILHECTRVLKKGGSLIIGVPNLAALHNRLFLLVGKQPTCIRTTSAHVRGYTMEGMTDFINIFKGGYHLTNFKGSNFYPFSASIARPLSKILPTYAVSLFFKFQKNKEYTDEYIKYPINQRLATNYFVGE